MAGEPASVESDLIRIFPEIEAIEDATLREGVIAAWQTALEENPDIDIAAMPWGAYHDDITGESQVDHIRQVTQHAVSIAEVMCEHRPGLELDMDRLLASALLHDVSKCYEMADGGTEFSTIGDLLPHPVLAVSVLHRHDMPIEIIHNVFAHTHQTATAPVTIEGKIVKLADIVTLEALSWDHRGRPHNRVETSHYG